MWYWTETNSLGVAFAVWVLQHDGLRAPPFDVHPEGDGRLRMLGVGESNWRSWLGTIVRAEAQLADFMSRHDIRTLTAAERQELGRLDDQREPVACWLGDLDVGSALEQLLTVYRPLHEDRERGGATRQRRSWISASQERRLWRQLEPLHDRLPTLRVYPVDYPAPVALAIPPETCVVAIAAADTNGRAYVDSVTAAARQLATLRGGDAATSYGPRARPRDWGIGAIPIAACCRPDRPTRPRGQDPSLSMRAFSGSSVDCEPLWSHPRRGRWLRQSCPPASVPDEGSTGSSLKLHEKGGYVVNGRCGHCGHERVPLGMVLLLLVLMLMLVLPGAVFIAGVLGL